MPRCPVVPSTSCVGCLHPADKLYPFRPGHFLDGWATPLYCDRCIKGEWRRKRREAAKVNAKEWVERQTELIVAKAYAETSFYEAHRGMIRTEPFPEQGRHISFVWELNPGRTLVTEYMQMPRYVKTNWGGELDNRKSCW